MLASSDESEDEDDEGDAAAADMPVAMRGGRGRADGEKRLSKQAEFENLMCGALR
jgi:hypothetical protein